MTLLCVLTNTCTITAGESRPSVNPPPHAHTHKPHQRPFERPRSVIVSPKTHHARETATSFSAKLTGPQSPLDEFDGVDESKDFNRRDRSYGLLPHNPTKADLVLPLLLITCGCTFSHCTQPKPRYALAPFFIVVCSPTQNTRQIRDVAFADIDSDGLLSLLYRSCLVLLLFTFTSSPGPPPNVACGLFRRPGGLDYGITRRDDKFLQEVIRSRLYAPLIFACRTFFVLWLFTCALTPPPCSSVGECRAPEVPCFDVARGVGQQLRNPFYGIDVGTDAKVAFMSDSNGDGMPELVTLNGENRLSFYLSNSCTSSCSSSGICSADTSTPTLPFRQVCRCLEGT